MKKLMVLILAVLFLLCLFTGCDSNQEDVSNEMLGEPRFNVSIEIECVENWFFSKYDVDVYVDNHFEGTVTHGDTKIFDLNLPAGSYVLQFVSAENESLTGEARISILKDESLEYRISCNSSGIDVETLVGTTPPKVDADVGDAADYDLDFGDAESFEAALNNGEKVKGRIVQFVVNSYRPDSALGINCWSSEHLNFISENELDVVAGDVIIGYITEEPSEVLGSWKIPYMVLVINDEKTDATLPAVPKETTPSTPVITVTMSEDEFVGMLYTDAEVKLREMGFTVFEYETLDTTDINKPDDTIGAVEIKSWSFGEGDFEVGNTYESDATVVLWYYVCDEPVPNLTIENCADLADLLALKDPTDPSVVAFANEYSGQTIEFDGCVVAMQNHDGYTTRWDILLGAGDYDPNSMRGPNFRLTDVNYYDMDVSGGDSIYAGLNIRIVAKVGSYNANTSLFELDIISIKIR